MMNHQINIGFETEVADENSVRELIRTKKGEGYWLAAD